MNKFKVNLQKIIITRSIIQDKSTLNLHLLYINIYIYIYIYTHIYIHYPVILFDGYISNINVNLMLICLELSKM